MFSGKLVEYRKALTGLFVSAGLLLTACSSGSSTFTALPSTTAPTRLGQLTPYQSPSAPVISTEVVRASSPAPTSLPSPTPTPRTHIVKKGEDMGGIAFLYHVSLEALMAANPTVKPNLMSVGTSLIIPPSKTQIPGAKATPFAGTEPQTPTPIAVQSGKLNCTSAEDGGIWCFLPVSHTQSFALEGLSAIFRLAGTALQSTGAQTVLEQTAFLPLDTLPAGVSLPLVAYFPPNQAARLSPPYQFSSETLSALPSANDGRYLPTNVKNSQVMIAENGLSAAISANLVLTGSGKANRVWVVAVAYDDEGNVTGVRRWEKQDARPLEGGQALTISMNVYSVSAKIARVDLVAESRP
jgi:LysM repeat protein